MTGEVGDSSQREQVLGLFHRAGRGMQKQGNIGRDTDDKLGAEILNWSGRQRRTSAAQRNREPPPNRNSPRQNTH